MIKHFIYEASKFSPLTLFPLPRRLQRASPSFLPSWAVYEIS